MRLSSFITRGLDSPRGLFLLALGLALLWRLPFVPYAVVNWDESSFILVADSWVRGHLPYTEIAENKPPLIFGFLALLQLVCGKSIVAVRLAGVVLVAVTAWLCALTTRRAFGLRGWSAVALLPVVALGTFAPGSGALMAEHLAQVALAAILYLLTGERFERKRAFLLVLARVSLTRVGVEPSTHYANFRPGTPGERGPRRPSRDLHASRRRGAQGVVPSALEDRLPACPGSARPRLEEGRSRRPRLAGA